MSIHSLPFIFILIFHFISVSISILRFYGNLLVHVTDLDLYLTQDSEVSCLPLMVNDLGVVSVFFLLNWSLCVDNGHDSEYYLKM